MRWLAVAGALLAVPALAGTPAETLEAASARVAEAGRAVEAAQRADDRVAALGTAIAGYEDALQALRAGVAAAAADERARALALAVRRDEIQHLLAALAAGTPEPQALHPGGPLAAARAAALTARLTPALHAEADRLRAELDGLEAARRVHARARGELAAGLAAAAAARRALGAALGSEPVEPGPALTMMARDSETLGALAAALAGTEGAPRAPQTAGPMRWPVTGTVLRRFQQPDAAGVRRPGLVVNAPALASVTAPADAVVRYAGPFLEYGYVVVLEPGSDTMVVLAGLARLRVRTGAAVRAGELLGLLGGRSLDVDEYVMQADDTGAGASETLYIEVRHGRGPVDPEPLFANG
jgi:septal ring factor EnvC (AmiA/AmiB activator)